MDGYEDFASRVLPALPEDIRTDLVALLFDRHDDTDFVATFDAFAGGQGFPTNAHDARFLLERSSFRSEKERQMATASTNEAEAESLEADNDDQLEALRGKMTALERALAPLGIDLAAEMHPLSLEGEFSSEDIMRLRQEL
jgi:hypothetical protein